MKFENIVLSVDEISITSRFYLPDDGSSVYPAVCICHGIPSGNPANPDDGGYPLLAEHVCSKGYAVFIFNFRGAGTSGGNLDMHGWTRDLDAVIDYLYQRREVDDSFLSLLGFSAGAAVSVVTAAHDNRVTSAIACSCPAAFGFLDSGSALERFRRIGTIRDKDFPESISEWAEGFRKVSPINCVQDISPRPVAFIHGEDDEVVEISHAYRLYDKAGEPKRLYTIPGAGHKLRNNEQALTKVYEVLNTYRRDNTRMV
ncbi:MAG: alpha/beta fold hydrolase [Dehalococcoidales bacterium]|nr:MAG: alpha/beta fold hydrolase [Dehalococcoidales bacterium]